MIAQELEISLHHAFVEARTKPHEYITLEHLLLSLLRNPSASEVMRACSARLDELRDRLTRHIDAHTPTVAAEREADTPPTIGFQRTRQRAILRVQSSSQNEV